MMTVECVPASKVSVLAFCIVISPQPTTLSPIQTSESPSAIDWYAVATVSPRNARVRTAPLTPSMQIGSKLECDSARKKRTSGGPGGAPPVPPPPSPPPPTPDALDCAAPPEPDCAAPPCAPCAP